MASLSIADSDLLSVAARGVYWRTLTRVEYRRAFGIARRHCLGCGKAFPVDGRGTCLLLSLRYYRGKEGKKHHYNLAKGKLSRSINLP